MLARRSLAALLLALPAAAKAAETQVTLDNFAFVPARLVVPAGTTVRFINRDDIPHTIVHAGGQGSFRSPVLDSEDSFVHSFDSQGRFAYFCSLHPHMQGEIEVT